MKKVNQIIPQLLTGGNLICGCLAILQVLSGNLILAAYFVAIATFLDFFDGMVARALGVSGDFGKQFDSLADCVTFGVVPGMVLMQLIDRSLTTENLNVLRNESLDNRFSVLPTNELSYIALLITVFSAVRLAKFNIDKRQSDKFIGLPTPANSIFILSIGYIIADDQSGYWLKSFLMQKEILISIAIVFSYLLVAELPLFSLKFKDFSWNNNRVRYMFIFCCLVFFVFLKVVALPLIISSYVLINLMIKLTAKEKN